MAVWLRYVIPDQRLNYEGKIIDTAQENMTHSPW